MYFFANNFTRFAGRISIRIITDNIELEVENIPSELADKFSDSKRLYRSIEKIRQCFSAQPLH
jgi:hypothetical protein